jgi:hypothetical protein
MLRIERGRNVRKGLVLLRLSDCEDNIRWNSNDISYMLTSTKNHSIRMNLKV